VRAMATYHDRLEYWASLAIEFGVDETGLYKFHDGERGEADFQCVKAAVKKRRQEFMSEVPDHTDVVGVGIQALMWPFRNTLEDNPSTHLTVAETSYRPMA